MLVLLASSCTTGTHLVQLCFGLLQFSMFRLWPLDWTLLEKVLFDEGPAQCSRAPPASSTVTTLFTPHKQAGRPPRFEAALCYCRGREAHTNSHIQNDMISQLEARARQEISTVRQLWCGLQSIAVTLVGFHADFCQTQAGSWPSEANTTKTSRNLDQSFRHSVLLLHSTIYIICQWPPRSLFVMVPESFTCGYSLFVTLR